MMLRIRFALPLAFVLASSAAFAQNYSTVEERMTGAEFKAAGLDKLSPEELAALNAWLQQQSGRVLATISAQPTTQAAERIGFEDAPLRRDIVSRIAGEFRGWSGIAQFELENGQIWRMTEPSTLSGVQPVQNPKVTIRPRMLSGWTLQVEGYNTRAKVERVK